MSKQIEVLTLPECDFCKNGAKAEYDAKTFFGPWGYMCKFHFRTLTCGRLGTGIAQRLVLASKP